ncbi:alpha/beta hydrolase [Niabella sp. CJ426]|uniref:alpha/beta hydrolase n=1 Tax=Niabella sp. CJ426 TaxID=3393740 RepID=UPI003D047AD3
MFKFSSIDKKYFLFLMTIFVTFNAVTGCRYHSPQEEQFSFKIDNGLELRGTLSLPSTHRSVKTIFILVSPPGGSDRNYHGLFKSLAIFLADNGIASLRFDNRVYANKKDVNADAVDMFDQANDVHSALLGLKKDSRFKNYKIGLVGHSEGGCSVAIEASRNKDVSFAILLSTIGINGNDLSYYQLTNGIKKLKGEHLTEKDEAIFSDWRDRLDIIASNNNIDSIKLQLSKSKENLLKKHPDFAGKQSIEESQKTDSSIWLNKHRIAYIKYKPNLYLSKITADVLAICGDKDDKLDCEQNINGIKRIFDSSHKQNYKVVVLENMNHDYQIVGETRPILKSATPIELNFPDQVFFILKEWLAQHEEGKL